MRRLIATFLAAVLAGGGSVAQGAGEPEELVRSVTNELIEAVNEHRQAIEEDPRRIRDLAAEIILPHVDFRVMAQRVLGPHWRDASSEQRERFAKEFRIFLVRTYSRAFEEFLQDADLEDAIGAAERIRYLPMRGDVDDGRVMVRTEIRPDRGSAIPVNYSMHKRDGTWLVNDVVVENISLIQNYRSSFVAEIRSRGMDGLLQQLEERNRQARRE